MPFAESFGYVTEWNMCFRVVNAICFLFKEKTHLKVAMGRKAQWEGSYNKKELATVGESQWEGSHNKKDVAMGAKLQQEESRCERKTAAATRRDNSQL